MNLYCLPFSGGNCYSYRIFGQLAPAFLRIKPLEYPGRGSRAREDLLRRIDPLVDDLYGQLPVDPGDTGYAIYGHSLGGLVAYLLARKLIENKRRLPDHLFVSGAGGPAAESEDKSYLLSRAAFIHKLRDLNGCPDEILDNEELFSYFEPILRADFEVSDTYMHIRREPMDIPITVITGTEEDLKPDEIRLWQQETVHEVDFIQMPGKHFFIFDDPGKVVDTIAGKLTRQRAASDIK